MRTSKKLIGKISTVSLWVTFNIDLLNFNAHKETEDFINTLGTYSFHPHILKPTRITSHSATLIDNIFFNSLEHQTSSGNILCDITDHLPNFLIINKFSTLPKNFKMYKRDYSKFNKEALISELNNINWNDVLYVENYSNNVNSLFESFHSYITKCIDKYVPLRKLTRKEIRSLTKPWIIPGIIKSSNIKSFLYKKYLKTRSTYYYTKYKCYRSMICKLLRISKQKYYHNYFAVNSRNMKNIWSGIKELITLKPRGFNSPSKIIVDNLSLKDPNTIASAFNQFFANIGSKLANEIPLSNLDPLNCLETPISDSFYLFPTTTAEIEDILSTLNQSKSVGPFSIPVYLLKLLRSCLSIPLEIIYNLSFSSGCVPDQFKLANIIPIHKTNSVTCLNNYRPISLLSIFNKILEKLMFKRLFAFVNKHNILFANQFGFRENFSTMQATLLITDKIQRAIEEGQYSCGIFLDFSKAFDTVNHSILIRKLHHYGIRGIANDWFTSYLSNRRQFVSIGSTKSDTLTISHGVPQGSVLGPLLFLLYINDFHKCCNLFDFHIFADDTNLFYSLIYPFLTYSLITWGNTYSNSLKPLIVLQKKAIRIITFADFNAHTTPLFYKLGLLKFADLIYMKQCSIYV